MTRYSEEQKSAIMEKLLPPNNMSVTALSREVGIPIGTLYTWLDKARQQGICVPKKSKPNHWSAEKKLATVTETAAMSEAEISQYCRTKGLYPEQIQDWKRCCLQGFNQNQVQENKQSKQSKADKQEIKQLKRELRQKEKALAETAALLVLRKKLNALWENEDEES